MPVGVFHGGQANAGSGLILYHALGAGPAMVGGNVAVILAGVALLRSHAPRPFGSRSVALGAIGAVSPVTLRVDSPSTTAELLSDGVRERGAVYPIRTLAESGRPDIRHRP
ncbi:hypothetical protein ACFY7Z_05540 [Streptomyces sp. NPDC012623]|uniref:hypothetical protein n=1 Tax=unclassified Streptomyces TaxID=2593676 RepID=UPI003675C58E